MHPALWLFVFTNHQSPITKIHLSLFSLLVFLPLNKTSSMKYLLPCVLILFFACKNQTKEATQNTADGSLPEGFTEFYQRFHSDSAFQMAHIIFPLEGLPHQADAETISSAEFRWQAEDWKMMRPVDWQMSEYQREIVPLNSTLILERIVNPDNNIGMVRRYAIIGDEWHLIYYAGLNRMK